MRFAASSSSHRLSMRQGVAAVLAAVVTQAISGCGGGGDLTIDAPAVSRASPQAPTAWVATPAQAEAEAAAFGSAATAAPTATAAAPAPRASATSGAGGLVILRQPLEVQVPAGSVAQFNIEAAGARGITYQWLRDDEIIPGATGVILQLPVTSADDLAKISVIVSAGSRVLQSAPARLRVSRH